jgi:hypothetical protein
MASFVKFNTFVEALSEKAHNLGADTLKCALTDTLPTAASDSGFLPGSSHPPPAAVNGYTTGGNSVTVSSSAQTSGTYKLVLADTSFSASGGSLGPFRYAVLYNDTAASDELIGYWDYGSSVTLADGETFTVDFDASAGVLTLA